MTTQSMQYCRPKLAAGRVDCSHGYSAAGSAASVLTVTFGLSYSLLIFAGPLAPYLSYGVAATFISSAILAGRDRARKLAALCDCGGPKARPRR